MKIQSLVLFVLISMNNAFAQSSQVKVNSNIRKVQSNKLTSDDFKKVYLYFQDLGFLKLPANYDRQLRYYMVKNNLTRVNPYPYFLVNNGQIPFYVNVNKKDKKKNDKETSARLFDETNGDYVLGVVQAISGDHISMKEWLVTFSFSGKVIASIPIREMVVHGAYTTEAVINQDFTVDVYCIDFPGNDYIVKDHKPLDNLKGQRIDTKYQITPEGKFEKLSEVHYQSQIYSPAMLLDKTTNIRDRNEKRLNK
ncbi:MAG: hypothetical protein ACLVC8_11445 [Bacteroides ovatus]|mgnify:CR=1 FL=1|uniref:hypothetical protein n=1 Tax=Bacteroides sp. TaxID=29523 RepID=UPI003A31A054